MYRSGHFVTDKSVLSLKICGNHRERLLFMWRKQTEHVPIQATQGIWVPTAGPSLCKEVWLHTGQILSVGLGINYSFSYISNYYKQSSLLKCQFHYHRFMLFILYRTHLCWRIRQLTYSHVHLYNISYTCNSVGSGAGHWVGFFIFKSLY